MEEELRQSASMLNPERGDEALSSTTIAAGAGAGAGAASEAMFRELEMQLALTGSQLQTIDRVLEEATLDDVDAPRPLRNRRSSSIPLGGDAVNMVLKMAGVSGCPSRQSRERSPAGMEVAFAATGGDQLRRGSNASSVELRNFFVARARRISSEVPIMFPPPDRFTSRTGADGGAEKEPAERRWPFHGPFMYSPPPSPTARGSGSSAALAF